MKKTLIFIFASLFICTFSLAQEEIPTVEKPQKIIERKQEIGINSTYLIKQLISISDTSIATSPYLLTYKSMFNNFGVRIGVGASYNKQKSEDEDFDDSDETSNYSFDLRVGVEWQKAFHRRWTAIFGIDAVIERAGEKFVADTGFDVFTQKQTTSGYGGGPVFGLYFHFNDHLSLYTESAFYLLQKEVEDRNEFTNFPQFDDQINQTTETELITQLPSTLYLVFRF